MATENGTNEGSICPLLAAALLSRGESQGTATVGGAAQCVRQACAWWCDTRPTRACALAKLAHEVDRMA